MADMVVVEGQLPADLEEDDEYRPILPTQAEEVSEYRLQLINEAFSKEKLDKTAEQMPAISRRALAYELKIEKRNSDDPNVGIERIASWMLRVADYYSCAVSYLTRDDGTSYYKAVVCFKKKVSEQELAKVFPMADISMVLDYKKCFYNMIFGLAEHDTPLCGEKVVVQKVIGEIACSIESKEQLRTV